MLSLIKQAISNNITLRGQTHNKLITHACTQTDTHQQTHTVIQKLTTEPKYCMTFFGT